MVKVYGTNAREYVEDKLGFVEFFAQGDVEVRIKETKSTDLRVATIKYRLKGHPKPVYISTEETRSVKKAIDVLADKVSVKIAKDQDKYEARKRKKRRKVKEEQLKREEELLEEQLDIEELDLEELDLEELDLEELDLEELDLEELDLEELGLEDEIVNDTED